MKNKHLYLIWGFLYALCAGLGFITGARGLGRLVLIALGLVFFVPPAMLLYRDHRAGQGNNAKIIRTVSLAWLGVCLLLLILNIFSVAFTMLTGNILHGLLTVLTSPMVCGKIWALTIFLWACLLTVSHNMVKKAA